MPANTNNPTDIDLALYTTFRVREKRPDNRTIETTLPFCLVQLRGDEPTSAFWMCPAPEADANPGSLADAMSYPLNIDEAFCDGPGQIFPAGSDASGSLGVMQWSAPGI